MSRPKWKGFFTNLKENDKKKYKSYILTKNSKIIPQFLNKTFEIFNGKEFYEIEVNQDMIGHKFGEFVLTRKKFVFKKKSKKK